MQKKKKKEMYNITDFFYINRQNYLYKNVKRPQELDL